MELSMGLVEEHFDFSEPEPPQRIKVIEEPRNLRMLPVSALEYDGERGRLFMAAKPEITIGTDGIPCVHARTYRAFESAWLYYRDTERRELERTARDAAQAKDDERERRERTREKKARVYFIQGEGGGPIKIGKAARIDRRIAGLHTVSPVKLVLLGHIPGGYPVEGKMHKRFAEHRLHGEWFHPAPELLEFIAGLPVTQ
jgi:hypothetical protein